jgi:hypothetical protein
VNRPGKCPTWAFAIGGAVVVAALWSVVASIGEPAPTRRPGPPGVTVEILRVDDKEVICALHPTYGIDCDWAGARPAPTAPTS